MRAFNDHPYLQELNKLEDLGLGYNQVTNSGLERLGAINNLQSLYLLGTDATNEGVKKLHVALPNCVIDHK